MEGPSEVKQPRYDNKAVGKGLLVGLYDHDSRDHAMWVAHQNEIFERRVMKDEAYFAMIQIVAHKTLSIKANLYTGEITLEFRSMRPRDPVLTLARANFALRLTLEEWEGFQSNIKWIQAFIKKVQAGQFDLDSKSPGVTQEMHGYLGYHKKVTEEFTVVMKFKKDDRATNVELRKGRIGFNICAGGFEYFVQHMNENVRTY
jgi:hypothetical protein